MYNIPAHGSDSKGYISHLLDFPVIRNYRIRDIVSILTAGIPIAGGSEPIGPLLGHWVIIGPGVRAKRSQSRKLAEVDHSQGVERVKPKPARRIGHAKKRGL